MICLFAALTFGAAKAQNTEKNEVPANGAKISFTETEHNYGTIQKGGNGDCEFTFKNEGNEPLILQNVKASCGCTTPSYTQKPVMPGQTGTIRVHYNTNNVGGFSKSVTVTSNAVDNPRVVLRIKGNVKQDAAQEQSQAKPQVKVEPKSEKAASAKDEKKMERIMVNPSTGQRMLVPPKLVLTFKPNVSWKERVKNGGAE